MGGSGGLSVVGAEEEVLGEREFAIGRHDFVGRFPSGATILVIASSCEYISRDIESSYTKT